MRPEHQNDSERLNLEQAILGACLQEQGYSVVAGILTSKNFTGTSSFDHQVIFKAIETLYPNRPIDLLTVTHEINKRDYAWYLSHCTARVSSTANLKYHAFLLLQLSMRDSLIGSLVKTSESTTLTTTTRSAIQDIIDECLDPSNDILHVYEKAPQYLRSIGVDDELLVEIDRHCSSLPKKIQLIKSYSHIDCLMRSLEQICKNGYDARSKLCLGQITELAKIVLMGKSIPDGVLEGLNEIHQLIDRSSRSNTR